ncbi:MAG: hypothetical protein LBG82_00900, partial [Clostridiales Family XIII bacterium]|nr:hypothetical protein [Clostridiales Family XIII bacterium]
MRRLCAILEYDKIIGLLAERASSALGAERASSLLPAVSPNEIRQRLSETADAVSFIMQKGAIGLGEFGDISQPVSYAEKGGSLTPAQLLAVSVQMAAARRAVGFLKVERGRAGARAMARESAGAGKFVGAGASVGARKSAGTGESAGTGKSAGAGESVGAGCWENMESSTLVQLASVISVRKDIEDRIRSSILSDTEIADGASAELRRIRRQIANQSDNIRAQL